MQTKFTLLTALVVGLCVLWSGQITQTNAQATGCPRGVRPRQEIRTLSTAQRTSFFNAVVRMQSGTRPTAYDRFSQVHYSVRSTAHGYPWFFSWHRAYLRAFEQALQAFDANIMLPFWDWSYDSQAPELSPIWQSTWYGGNGRSNDSCVADGQFRAWRPSYPSSHCLQRRWDNDNRISAYYSTEALRSIMTSTTTYDSFRRQIEAVPHGQVHVSIGLDMSTMYSPNDPIFWLHHGFIDKLWADWQKMSSGRANSYTGRNSDGTTARLTDRLAPYPQTVQQVMRTDSLCYTYAAFPTTTAALPTAPPAAQAVQAQPSTSRAITSTDAAPSAAAGNGTITPAVAAATGALPTASATNAESASASQPAVVVPVTTDKPVTPPATDREELAALRAVPQVPDQWLTNNNHNVQEARDTEKKLYSVTDAFNKDPKYVSPVALIRRPDLTSILAQTQSRFTVSSGNQRVLINTRLTKNMREMLGKAVQRVVDRQNN